MYFSAAASSEKCPRQHELGLEDGFCALHDAVEGRHHPGNGRVPDAALNINDASARVALVPSSVERFRGGPKLHDEVAGKVLRLNLAPLLAPKVHQRGFIGAHDDPGVGAADE